MRPLDTLPIADEATPTGWPWEGINEDCSLLDPPTPPGALRLTFVPFPSTADDRLVVCTVLVAVVFAPHPIIILLGCAREDGLNGRTVELPPNAPIPIPMPILMLMPLDVTGRATGDRSEPLPLEP